MERHSGGENPLTSVNRSIAARTTQSSCGSLANVRSNRSPPLCNRSTPTTSQAFYTRGVSVTRGESGDYGRHNRACGVKSQCHLHCRPIPQEKGRSTKHRLEALFCPPRAIIRKESIFIF